MYKEHENYLLHIETVKQHDVPEEDKQRHAWLITRRYRNELLLLADIEIFKQEDNGQDASAWRTYRQQLRDLPSTFDSPFDVVFPNVPFDPLPE